MRPARVAGAMAGLVVGITFALAPVAAAQTATPSTSGAPSASASPTSSQRTFTVGVLDDLNTLNPMKAVTGTEYEYLTLNYDLAIDFSMKDLSPTPGLVTQWSHSADGLTWTYTVRQGATWQDGQPLTAKDIAFTYEFMVKNHIGAFSNYFPFTQSVTAPNDTTVIWTTTKPTMAPIFPPWVYILPQHIWGSFTKKQAMSYQHIPVVGSGPFQLVQWQKGQFWKFRSYPGYWGGAPYIHTLIFQKFDNAEAMVQALKKGEIDFAENIPADLFDTLKGQSGITTNVGAPTTYDDLVFNVLPNGQVPPTCKSCGASTANPALSDVRVRTAIEYAIDKQALVDKVMRGYAVPGTTIVPSGFAQWHDSPPSDQLMTFDIQKANQILDQAGYKDTNGDGIRNDPKTGKDLDLRFFVLSSEPQEVTGAQLIKGWLKQIGIQVNPQVMTEGKLIDQWTANDFDIYMWGWGPDPDPDFILSTFATFQCESWSDTCVQNPQYNRLYQEQHSTIDVAKRKQIVDQLQMIVYKTIPEVVLYYGEDLQAYRSDRWTGFVSQPQPQGFLLFQYGHESYLKIRPASFTTSSSASSGISGGVWGGVAAGLVVIVGAVILVRRRSQDERA